MRRRFAVLTVGLLLLAGCSDDDGAEPGPSPDTPSTQRGARDQAPEPKQRQRRAPRFDTDAVLRDIRHLSRRIGPREATSARFRRVAGYVQDRFDALGYTVRRVPVRVPAGDSWGVPVDAGRSFNVIAEPPGLRATGRYAIVGAHLDSVAVSPGAEDNASGVAVLLELARMARQSSGTPVRFIAFGAEEPRGPGDAMHHFGSRAYVRTLPPPQRRRLQAMVSLDRVGIAAPAVPICRGGPGGTGVRRELLRAARSADVAATGCADRASDHWSFEKAGLPAARIGSVPYAGYHSERDLPYALDRRQLNRVGAIMWRWMR